MSLRDFSFEEAPVAEGKTLGSDSYLAVNQSQSRSTCESLYLSIGRTLAN